MVLGGVIRHQLFGVTVFDPCDAGISVDRVCWLASAALASLAAREPRGADRSGQGIPADADHST